MKELASRARGVYTGDLKNTVKWIKANEKQNDLILTLGAGDIFYTHKSLINK